MKFILENEGKLFLILLNNNDNENQIKMKLDHITNLNIVFSKIKKITLLKDDDLNLDIFLSLDIIIIITTKPIN